MDTIQTVQAIDWGLNHCVFVDRRNRVFSFGHNRYGRTGLKLSYEPDAADKDDLESEQSPTRTEGTSKPQTRQGSDGPGDSAKKLERQATL